MHSQAQSQVDRPGVLRQAPASSTSVAAAAAGPIVFNMHRHMAAASAEVQVCPGLGRAGLLLLAAAI